MCFVHVQVRVGLFDLFTPSEWQSNNNPGRNLVGILAQEYLKQQSKA